MQSVVIALMASTNMPGAFAALSMTKCGALNVQETNGPVNATPLLKAYLYSMLLVYSLPACVLALTCLPTFIAYCWFFIPLIVMIKCMAIFGAPMLSKLLVGLTGEHE